MYRPPPRQSRSSISREEERIWIGFYQRVGRDPALATELLALMKSDAVMRRDHLALYLCCRESIRCHQARQWRDQQLANIVRRGATLLFVAPFRVMRRWWQRGGDIAIECLPPSGSSTPLRQHKNALKIQANSRLPAKKVSTGNGLARMSEVKGQPQKNAGDTADQAVAKNATDEFDPW